MTGAESLYIEALYQGLTDGCTVDRGGITGFSVKVGDEIGQVLLQNNLPMLNLPENSALVIRSNELSRFITEHSGEEDAKSDAVRKHEAPSPVCEIFRKMNSLIPNEITLDFVAGESGG